MVLLVAGLVLYSFVYPGHLGRLQRCSCTVSYVDPTPEMHLHPPSLPLRSSSAIPIGDVPSSRAGLPQWTSPISLIYVHTSPSFASLLRARLLLLRLTREVALHPRQVVVDGVDLGRRRRRAVHALAQLRLDRRAARGVVSSGGPARYTRVSISPQKAAGANGGATHRARWT